MIELPSGPLSEATAAPPLGVESDGVDGLVHWAYEGDAAAGIV